LYDGEIATSDAAVARIVKAAYEAGPDESPPLVMIVSDHGESLGERQESTRVAFGHGVLLYQETVHVPWIVVWERHLKKRVYDTYVSLVDLAPTLMDMVHFGNGYRTEGRSLALYMANGEESPQRRFFLERRLFGSRFMEGLEHPETAIVDFPWKLIENRGVGRRELYDLASDPDERHEQSAEQAAVAARLGKELGAWIDDHPLPRQQGPANRAQEQEDEVEREALRSLGYID
jgi:arylsulfatase A-like enzyme